MRIAPTPFLAGIMFVQVCLSIALFVLMAIVGLSQSRYGELYAAYADDYAKEMTNSFETLPRKHMGYTPDGIARKAHERARNDCRLVVTAQVFAVLLLALSGFGVLLSLDARKEAKTWGQSKV